MQLLSMACLGDVKGVEELLKGGVDVNSIDLDGRTVLHIAACEGHVEVVKLLLQWRANIDTRDQWGSTPTVDAKFYGNTEVFNILKARGAKVRKTGKTPMTVSNIREVPEYELDPLELQFRRGEDISKGTYQMANWNGTKVSVKILDKECYYDPESINAFKHELALLQRGNLASYLQKKGRFQPHKAFRFALDIARGMNYLHECRLDPIIHCDLKLEEAG